MDQLFGTIFGMGLGLLSSASIDAAAAHHHHHHHQKKKKASKAKSNTRDILVFSQSPSTNHSRAILVAANSENFGKICERLVNIAFHTSQTFPTMMGTFADIDEYLRKELCKHYPTEYFHIVIGENHAFNFAVDDATYFAEIEQELYRVLIFTTKQSARRKMDTHDANSGMLINWNLFQ